MSLSPVEDVAREVVRRWNQAVHHYGVDRLETAVENKLVEKIASALRDREQQVRGEEQEKAERKCLWLHHGHFAVLYGDDGEMQCAHKDHGPLDFKRDSIASLYAAVLRRRAQEGETKG